MDGGGQPRKILYPSNLNSEKIVTMTRSMKVHFYEVSMELESTLESFKYHDFDKIFNI